MTVQEVMAELKSLGDEKVRAMNARNGVGENQFGVKMGDLRILAKEIKADPTLAKELWATGNADARLLATLVTKPKELKKSVVDAMVREVNYMQLAEWLTSYA